MASGLGWIPSSRELRLAIRMAMRWARVKRWACAMVAAKLKAKALLLAMGQLTASGLVRSREDRS